MLVPLPPKSHTATIPRAGMPGLARTANSVAAASGISVSGRARFDHSDTRLSAEPSASTAVGSPVRRIGHRDAFGQGAPAGGGVGQRAQPVGDQCLAAMRRAVGRHDADRVSDPIHEVGDHQAGLVEPRVFRRHADLGRTLAEQRQHRFAGDGVIGGYGRQVGGTNRQSQRGPSYFGHLSNPRVQRRAPATTDTSKLCR